MREIEKERNDKKDEEGKRKMKLLLFPLGFSSSTCFVCENLRENKSKLRYEGERDTVERRRRRERADPREEKEIRRIKERRENRK